MKIFGFQIPSVFSLLIWAGVWEVIGQLEWVFIFPPLSGVLIELWDLVGTNAFHKASISTLKSFCYGMFFAITGGVSLGFFMGRVDAANKLLGMWVNIFASAPLSSLVPVLILLFGLGQTTIIVTVVLFAIWIITLDTLAGIKHVSPSLIEMGQSFGASRWNLLYKILFWAALPEILAGIRMGFIRAVKGVIIGQLLVSIIDFGQMFATFSRNLYMEEFWALTLVLFVFALGISSLIGEMEKRVEYYAGVRD
jgi:NitT/TauT family transport system permease protein|tara:strand:- start:11187 stop:11942 length:756 start_codon:yes stop_codon:yes gene_type:complete